MNSTLRTTPEKTTHAAAAISVISSQTSSGPIPLLTFPTLLPVPNSFNKGGGVSVPISLLMPADAFQVGGRRTHTHTQWSYSSLLHWQQE